MRLTVRPVLAAGVAFACLVAYAALPAGAHKGAAGIVKERMDDMKLLKDSMKALASIMKGERDFTPDFAAGHARKIAAVGERMPNQFPTGSNAMPSEALDAIWQDWPAFTKSAEEMRAAAVAMTGAGTVSTFRETFAAVGATCQSCHKKFRREE